MTTAKDISDQLALIACHNVIQEAAEMLAARTISDEDAAKFLREIDSDMDDAMVSAGWTVIKTLGRQKGFTPVETIDDDDEEYEDE